MSKNYRWHDLIGNVHEKSLSNNDSSQNMDLVGRMELSSKWHWHGILQCPCPCREYLAGIPGGNTWREYLAGSKMEFMLSPEISQNSHATVIEISTTDPPWK